MKTATLPQVQAPAAPPAPTAAADLPKSAVSESSLSESALIDLAQRGDHTAQTALLHMHRGMIHRQAWIAKSRHPNADLNDLLQAGRMGLLHAIEKFQPNRGTKLITYATWWIRQTVDHEAEESYLIHVPSYIREGKNTRYSKEAEAVRRVVWPDQMAGGVAGSRDDAGEGRSFELMSADRECEFESDEISRLREVIEKLDAREREILQSRYMAGQTLQEIGDRLGVCKERIRQIQNMAMKKVRKMMRAVVAGVDHA